MADRVQVREIDNDEGRRLLPIVRRGTCTRRPPRIAIICDNFSPHLTTKVDTRVEDWAAVNNVEIAYTPTNSSWLQPQHRPA